MKASLVVVAVALSAGPAARGQELPRFEVVDRTGLSGRFDGDLLFMPEIARGGFSLDRIARDPLVAAQAAAPRFEVASITVNRATTGEPDLRVQPGGRFAWTSTTLRNLIGTSFQRFAFDQREIEGGPAWIDTARFDVLVQTGSGAPPTDPEGFPGTLFAMIQTLLRERFSLATHEEVRERPIYRLVTVRADSRLGPELKAVAGGCGEALKALSNGERATERTGRGPDCAFGGPPGQLQGNAVTMDMLARVIGGQVRRPVVNATGIEGSFDVDLTFSPEFVPPPPGSRVGDLPPSPSDAPSIFTALQEQLGLRLESARGEVSVLVVDRAEMPRPE